MSKFSDMEQYELNAVFLFYGKHFFDEYFMKRL
jgi:hypothetical protein